MHHTPYLWFLEHHTTIHRFYPPSFTFTINNQNTFSTAPYYRQNIYHTISITLTSLKYTKPFFPLTPYSQTPEIHHDTILFIPSLTTLTNKNTSYLYFSTLALYSHHKKYIMQHTFILYLQYHTTLYFHHQNYIATPYSPQTSHLITKNTLQYQSNSPPPYTTLHILYTKNTSLHHTQHHSPHQQYITAPYFHSPLFHILTIKNTTHYISSSPSPMQHTLAIKITSQHHTLYLPAAHSHH